MAWVQVLATLGQTAATDSRLSRMTILVAWPTVPMPGIVPLQTRQLLSSAIVPTAFMMSSVDLWVVARSKTHANKDTFSRWKLDA